MSEELFEHTTGQGKEDEDSKQQMEAAQFSENLYDNKIDKDAILQAIASVSYTHLTLPTILRV